MDLPGVVRASAAGFRSGEPWREPHEQDRELVGAYARLREPERHPAKGRLCVDAPLSAASNVSCSVAASVASTSARPSAPRPDRVAGGLVAPRISFRRALPRHLLRGCPGRFRPSRPDAVNAAARPGPSRALATAAYARLHASELSLAGHGTKIDLPATAEYRLKRERLLSYTSSVQLMNGLANSSRKSLGSLAPRGFDCLPSASHRNRLSSGF
jgi:hypothetical protein